MINLQSILFILLFLLAISITSVHAQSWKLTEENILRAIESASEKIEEDTLRPAYHLTPPAGCMGDPNGGIYFNGWHHIFYGLQPFSGNPGAWYWAHARSRDLMHWEALNPGLTPAFDLGLDHVGSGSTFITDNGKPLAFYSVSEDDTMKFWQAQFNDDLTQWEHNVKEPILTLQHPELPDFDKFWRDPFVFEAGDKTLLIACADLFEADYVPVPIFEAKNKDLTSWDYKGTLFSYPKHKARNLEVPEFRKLEDKWILMASTDAPVDRTRYFLGEFNTDQYKFDVEREGILDYSGHYYAQETIPGENGALYLMAWIPGWDRGWLPTYMNEPLKNSSPIWNGCFALPRQLSLDAEGNLIQQPVTSIKELRQEHFTLPESELPVFGPTTEYDVLKNIRGDQLELKVKLDLHAASFCGLNVLCNDNGEGGLFIVWSGDVINVDGVKVNIDEWKKGDNIDLQIFIDNQIVEVFVNGGRYCISRQVRREHIQGDHIALSRLGGTARLLSLEAWSLKTINPGSSTSEK